MKRLKQHWRKLQWRVALVAAAAAFAVWPALAQIPVERLQQEIEQGRRIYMDGMRPSDEPLQGMRSNDTKVSGATAACVTCHRRSGMGGVEGDLQVPPITGRFLYAVRADMALAIMDPRFGRMMNQSHVPYDRETLSNAIRNGVNSGGRTMNVAMPHYDLSDAEMKSLIAYLSQLSEHWSPGVDANTIRFATVVVPGGDPARRQMVLDILRNSFAQKNGSTITAAQQGGRRHMVSGPEQILGTERKWELEVWELQGAPDTWAAQLDSAYRRQPVFALISGSSGGAWAPVHDFSERQQVPCWFPSVDSPPAQENAVYSVYFSRGLGLEADVLAQHLRALGKAKPKHLVQVFRDEVGRQAALALKRTLAGSSGMTFDELAVPEEGPLTLRRALAALKVNDAVMFWLPRQDLAVLAQLPAPSASVYISAQLGHAEHSPLTANWRKTTHLVYPYELPETREKNLSYFYTWLNYRHIALTDAALQSEVYFAVTFMTDTVSEMLDNLYRDYLLERAEDMMGKRETGRAESETRDRTSLGSPEQLALRYPHARKFDETHLSLEPGQGLNLLAMRRGTTVYPTLTLGPGQRFASKGAYIVHYGEEDDGKLVADSQWIVP
jgi:mono/diheme cytochrome c family protein